jgi:hypothetical protein
MNSFFKKAEEMGNKVLESIMGEPSPKQTR